MKLVKYKDPTGWLRQAYVAYERQPVEQGVPFNPPDLTPLALDEAEAKKLNNALVEAGLITHLNVLEAGGQLTSILTRQGLKHLRRQVITLYKLDR